MLFSVFTYSLRCFEHLVIGQSFGGGTLVAIHSVGFVMGDFLELVAERGKFIRQRIV